MQVDLAQFRTIFFEEAADHLEIIEESLQELAAAPGDPELVKRVFRSVHSVKGAANSFGLSEITDFAHHLENCLDQVRSGQAAPTDELTQLLIRSNKLLQALITAAQEDGDTPAELAAVIQELAATASLNDPMRVKSEPTKRVVKETFDADVELMNEFVADAHEHLETANELLLAIEDSPSSRVNIDGLYRIFHTIKGVAGFLGLDELQALTHQAEAVLGRAREGELELVGSSADAVFRSVDALARQLQFAERWLGSGGTLERDPALSGLLDELKDIQHRADEEPTTVSVSDEPSAVPDPRPNSLQENVKVDRERLDQLIDVIGELVIAESMVQIEFVEFQLTSRSLPVLSKIARELQDLSLSLRMVPIRATFQKMARIVRDVARKLGKKVTVRFEGEETELDKSMIDQIGDPLVHMVRNAVDHGIETPDRRKAAKKCPQGQLVLRAFHKGGNVCIEIEDDGRGLDRDVIRCKAVERGLIRDSDELSDRQIYNLVFEPGFSTAQAVTEISGRGVGMDVVRTNIESMQGLAEINSLPGEGATFSMWLPLTLAIVDGLLVRLGHSTYVLPLTSVVESLRPTRDTVRQIVDRGQVLVLRGETIPLVPLHQLFNLPAAVTDPCEGLLVVIENRGKKLALMVDHLVGQQQVVMKSLEANYEKVEGVSGATILGDGSVALIVDTAALHRLAELG
jgi:two-component system chemotaxis sensor kinase CheA